MATLAALRNGLADRLETIATLAGVYTEEPGQVETPAAVIRWASPAVTYATSVAAGSHDYQFSVLVLVSISQGPTAQNALDGYLDVSGVDSVFAAVEGDPDLGGACHTAAVTSVANVGLVEYPSGSGVTYLGAELLVSVLA